MPRQARLDFPGAFHHVMGRGLEQREIFRNEQDRTDFLARLGNTVSETQTRCFAFALMPNHFHILLQTGRTPISTVMQSTLTGYAVHFNLKHRRKGKLFQNRFKSVLCEKDDYFLELIRYIHLNPVRGGIVSSLDELARYPFTGHSALLGKTKREWLDAEEVLSRFGTKTKSAGKAYSAFVAEGLSETFEGKALNGGGLIRSSGGLWKVVSELKRGEKILSDERILGSSDFVERVLATAVDIEGEASRLKRAGWGFESVLEYAASLVGHQPEDLLQRGRDNSKTKGRALVCKWMAVNLDEPQALVARLLRISGPSVSALVKKGIRFEKEMDAGLPERP